MPPLTEVSSMYGIGMFIDGEVVTELEKPNDLAWQMGSALRLGSNRDRSISEEN